MLKTQLCLTVSKSILTCWATISNLFWSSVTPYTLLLQCCRCFSHLAVVIWKPDMQLICGINFGHPHTSGDARPVCRSISNAVFTNISAAVILNFLYPYFGSCELSSNVLSHGPGLSWNLTHSFYDADFCVSYHYHITSCCLWAQRLTLLRPVSYQPSVFTAVLCVQMACPILQPQGLLQSTDHIAQV